ncbi:MAG: hypothetical protein JWN70_6457 [Planctomycetaceae bacterium]|nr:hypothetical protein [Planctomycetaceae bacterium]
MMLRICRSHPARGVAPVVSRSHEWHRLLKWTDLLAAFKQKADTENWRDRAA